MLEQLVREAHCSSGGSASTDRPPGGICPSQAVSCSACEAWTVWVILAACLMPGTWCIERTVDRIELNHCPQIDQYVLWRWETHPANKWTVVDWRPASGLPDVRREGHRFVLSWRENGYRIRVEAGVYDESWTEHDVEVADREDWPVCKRNKIFRR